MFGQYSTTLTTGLCLLQGVLRQLHSIVAPTVGFQVNASLYSSEVTMAVVTGSVLIDILLALISALCLLYWYITNNDDYWDKRGVTNIKKGTFLGTILGKQSQADAVKEIYNQFPDERYVGLFQFKKPVLMVRDPTLINKVLVKDFTHFQDRSAPTLKKDLFSRNLLGLKGSVWRTLRHKLTPTFTTGKLRGMFEQISKSSENLITKIDEVSSVKNEDVDPSNVLFEFTLDVIASCAFGVQFPPDSPDFKKFKSIVEKMFTGSPLRFLKFTFVTLAPKIADYFNITVSPSELYDYFMNMTRANMKYRKENNIHRNDYFELLLSLKEQEEKGEITPHVATSVHEDDAIIDQMNYTEEDEKSIDTSEKWFTDESIASNTVIFLTGGSETVSRTICFVLFELSRHLEIQQKVQQEVDSVLSKHGELSFEALREMPYLDQVIQEAQRIYPVLPMLSRECVKPYKVPDSDLIIEKGTVMLIPVIGLHKDDKYYPDPAQFNPERFKGNNFKPNSTFLPFGDGPRICIAMRFAVMEVKACVAKIMSQYTVKLSKKTQVPLQFEVRSFLLVVKRWNVSLY
ncbi:LOW QUALITY PROTEIN: cytochrome P450 6k1-like [Homalodisca vitripennis]|uniref:LOW QUALITY PROTEIN: cytochrome P450 6k1-like n=1 Tax=Homalodisca vitripennis TaxID=197043 RepID=UPI001EEA41C4|nr:LOW QUALITY PROTEIN: cytochrome P450 6k1-like [Homalodisca vitripennis]